MKKLLTIGILFLSAYMVGCASTQSTEYYTAVQNAAIAQSNMMKARYDALGKIAGNGGEASTAAVMALAMTSQTPIVPQPQKSEALQWAQILAGPIAGLGSMWLSNDATKTMARYNKDTQISRINADQQNTTELYGLMGNNSDNMMDLGLGGFNALNTSMEYMDNSDITFPDYSTNFGNIDNYLLQIINNLNTSSTDDNQIWIPGVNCVNNANPGVIGVGGTVTVCPQ
tara:strand:+ start:18576 stop:19259 length:684 start_codon:yes stop_codon:yes gene_type:complete